MTRLAWLLGLTYNPSRRLFDGHGYSRLGRFWRRRKYTTPAERFRHMGQEAMRTYAEGLRRPDA